MKILFYILYGFPMVLFPSFIIILLFMAGDDALTMALVMSGFVVMITTGFVGVFWYPFKQIFDIQTATLYIWILACVLTGAMLVGQCPGIAIVAALLFHVFFLSGMMFFVMLMVKMRRFRLEPPAKTYRRKKARTPGTPQPDTPERDDEPSEAPFHDGATDVFCPEDPGVGI